MVNSLITTLVGICCLTPAALGFPNPRSESKHHVHNETGVPSPGADGKYTLEAEGIRAQFVPYGAGISNLFIKDKNGTERDIVLGWDNASYYTQDPWHDHYGSVPGRYANRIKNASFEIDGETFKVDANEHDGLNQLHGGSNGWDYRNFTVASVTKTSITFSIFDPDGEMGFPGDVISYITYTLSPYTWHISMTATALTKKTPIMLSSHVYWNLDGFQNPETELATDHTLYLPYSGLRIGVDSILIPTGEILPNTRGSVNDFWSEPKKIGHDLNSPDAVGNCGEGCTGWDNAYLVGKHDIDNEPVASIWSDWSGIKIDIFTAQETFQMYSCNGMKGDKPLKSTQGLPGRRLTQKYGCIVLEVEDWIDGINHPEWMRGGQIWGPEDGPYVLEATYKFSTV
ncbi:aldose 1-epimerase [Morchella snyderi]|nr:aldose 1-epimerase [Morchella snyderi]